MSLDVWISLVVLFFVGGLTPGPAVGLVMASAFQYGFKPSMLAAFGIASANVVWLLLAATGAMALLTTYPQAFVVMKFIGAGFILYLALTSIFGPLPNTATSSTKGLPRGKLYARGVGLQLSSPMPLVFFGGLLPTYFNANLPLPKQIFIMFITITATELVGLATYAAGAQRIKTVLKQPKAARGFNIAIGLLMIISGFWAIFATV